MVDHFAIGMMYAAVAILGFGAGILPRRVLRLLGRSISEVAPSMLQTFRIFAIVVGIMAIVSLLRIFIG